MHKNVWPHIRWLMAMMLCLRLSRPVRGERPTPPPKVQYIVVCAVPPGTQKLHAVVIGANCRWPATLTLNPSSDWLANSGQLTASYQFKINARTTTAFTTVNDFVFGATTTVTTP